MPHKTRANIFHGALPMAEQQRDSEDEGVGSEAWI